MDLNNSKKKILITGGLGFIGSHLAKKAISLGNEVKILSKSKDKIKNIKDIDSNLVINIQDIKDIQQKDVEGIDIIFHCASTVDNYNIYENPYLDIETNCNGTISLLESCRKFNNSVRIVYPSTFFVHGNLEKLPANSESSCKPIGLYSATKLAAENFCRTYNSLFDMDILIARFANVFGPFDEVNNAHKSGFNYLINRAVKGEEINLFKGGDFYRDYIYIDDVINACFLLSEKGNKDETYFIGRGEPVKFRDLVQLISSEVGGLNIQSLECPKKYRQMGIRDYYGDISSLKKLGWYPKVSLQEGIRRTVKYCRELK